MIGANMSSELGVALVFVPSLHFLYRAPTSGPEAVNTHPHSEQP
jgi:hypothetical protein